MVRAGNWVLLIEKVAKRKAVNPSHHAAYFAASAWARMGRVEEAVQSLREAAETGFPCYALFARDPILDPIRTDPRFQGFLADMQKKAASLRKALFDGEESPGRHITYLTSNHQYRIITMCEPR